MRVRVKMCGMTQKQDVAFACQLGVDALGFIFYQQSPRAVSLEQAQELMQGLPAFVDAVAVLVNPDKAFVNELIQRMPIQYLQFHGDESAEFCQQFGLPYIKAIAAKSTEYIHQSMLEFTQARALLLDTPADSSRGGTGTVFDWNVIPHSTEKPLILAGGLNDSNVLEAVHTCTPYAVDVNSGIESRPGIKDQAKMSQFIKVLWGNV